jgi:muconolactone delta-isomerase
MEFLVEFEIHVPAGTPEAEVGDRERAEASAAARLVADGHLLRVWTRADTTLGLYRAGSETELDRLLDALPLREWMDVTVTRLGPHPNDPAAAAPRLTPVYRLDATVGEPLDLGGGGPGPAAHRAAHRWHVHGAAAERHARPGRECGLADRPARRHRARRDPLHAADGRRDLLYVRSQAIRHGPPEVLARLARGEDVDAREYTFRAATRIETAAPALDWLNKGVFVAAAARAPAGVTYDTYLVE